jgi:hypothetical protein
MSGLSFYISPLSVSVTGSQPSIFTPTSTFSGDVTANVTWPANTFNSLFPIQAGTAQYSGDLTTMYFFKSYTLVAGSTPLSTQNVFPLMTSSTITYGTNSGLITSTMPLLTNTTIADEYLCYLNNKINGAIGQTGITNVSSYTTTLNTSINTAILSYLQGVSGNSNAQISTSANVNLNTSYLIYSQVVAYDPTRLGGNIVTASGGTIHKNLLKPGDIMYFQCNIATESSILDSTGNTIPNRTYLVKITLT